MCSCSLPPNAAKADRSTADGGLRSVRPRLPVAVTRVPSDLVHPRLDRSSRRFDLCDPRQPPLSPAAVGLGLLGANTSHGAVESLTALVVAARALLATLAAGKRCLTPPVLLPRELDLAGAGARPLAREVVPNAHELHLETNTGGSGDARGIWHCPRGVSAPREQGGREDEPVKKVHAALDVHPDAKVPPMIAPTGRSSPGRPRGTTERVCASLRS